MDARRRDIDAVLDELEVRFLLDPETAFEPRAGPDDGDPDGTKRANGGRSTQPDPPNRR
jgi:hypothetical protein